MYENRSTAYCHINKRKVFCRAVVWRKHPAGDATHSLPGEPFHWLKNEFHGRKR